jgi:hypothetical protein
MIELIKDIVFTITHPSYWMMQDSYNKIWDRRLQELAEKNTFTKYDGYHVYLGDTMLWVANHPFAAFTPARRLNIRPSRRTIHKLYKKLLEEEL